MQNRHAAFEYKAPNCSDNWHPCPTYFHAHRLTGWKFWRVFLHLRRDRKSGSSGHGVATLLRGRPLSNQIWLDSFRGAQKAGFTLCLSSPYSWKPYLLYCFSENMYPSGFPCFPRKPKKMLWNIQEEKCVTGQYFSKSAHGSPSSKPLWLLAEWKSLEWSLGSLKVEPSPQWLLHMSSWRISGRPERREPQR